MDRLKLSGFAALSLLAGLALAAVPVEAGTDSWSKLGQPSGGTVGKVVVDPSTPSTLYAVANQQVFKSTDSGASWTQVFSASSGTLVGDIALDPQSPGTLYAVFGDFGGAPGQINGAQGVFASDPGGIYKTTDGGATWAQIDQGIGFNTNAETNGAGPQVIDTLCRVAVDPVNEGTVYAGGCSSGMYKSTDGGASWNAIDTGLATVSVPAGAVSSIGVSNIVVDPVTPDVVYVESGQGINDPQLSTGYTHLYKSTDGGSTWNALAVNASGFDADLAIDPADHAHLVFCGMMDHEVSTDSGATWNPAGCPGYTLALAFDPSNSSHLLAAVNGLTPYTVYASTDGGASFTVETSVPPNGVESFGSIAFDPVTPANVYLGTLEGGVLKSADGGSTWSPSTQGITGVHAGQMLEGSDGVFYMGTANAGIYKSLDQGATWSEVGTGPSGALSYLADVTLSALAQDPSAPSTLYAGSWEGFDVSIDGGTTWNLSVTGMPSGARADSIAIDPEVPATLYAGIGFPGSGRNCGTSWCGALYKSVDGGATWADSSGVSSGLGLSYARVNGITVDPQQSKVVYAAADYDGVYKSVDGGADWTLSEPGNGQVQFYTVAVDPTNSNTVYASALQGFYKSTDGGATWVESDAGMTLGSQINGIIQIDSDSTSILYVSPKYGFGQTYVSSDAGATWFPLTAGLTTAFSKQRRTEAVLMSPRTMAASTSVQQVSLGAVMIDPHNRKQIYAAGSDGNVYTYDDLHPPSAAAGSGSTGASSGGSSGGGAFGLLSLLMLLGAGVVRKVKR